MASSGTLEGNLKSLRELLPENGSNIPDEFITDILKNNGNDLNRAYEELQTRLERSSWESVDKTKKKKGEKQQPEHTFSSSSAPSRGRGRGRGFDNFPRGESSRPSGGGGISSGGNGFGGGEGGRGGRGGGAREPGPPRGGARNAGGRPNPTESAPVNRPNTAGTDAEKKQVPAPVGQERPAIPELAPIPPSNQWAKGKPKIENPPEKIAPPPQIQQQHIPVQAAVPLSPAQPVPAQQSPQLPPQPQQISQPSPPQPQVQAPSVSAEILPPMDPSASSSASWGTGQGESAASNNIKVPIHSSNGGAVGSVGAVGGVAVPSHAPAHTAPAMGSTGGSRAAESIEKNQDARYRERATASSGADTEGLRNNFASLNVGQQPKVDASVPAQQSTGAAMQSSLAFSGPTNESQQMPYSAMPAQNFNYQQQYMPQYQGGFAQMPSNFQQSQEGEDFSAGRMQGMGMGDNSGYSMSAPDAGVAQRSQANTYGGKGAHGKQVQQVQQAPQQPGMGMQQWQQPLLNQYSGIMNNPMFGQPYMTAPQQLMYMQSYMGMPYASGMPGQMYNSATGYAANQGAGMGTKNQYSQQGANKKQQQQYSNYATSSYASAQYGQTDTATASGQDYYKAQGAPAAAFQGNYGFPNYTAGPMAVPYDGMSGYQNAQQAGSQAAYAGRGTGLAAGANGSGGAVDNSGMGYFQYPAVYPTATEDSQQQWRGGGGGGGGGGASGRDRGGQV